jgi:hypothetical protein
MTTILLDGTRFAVLGQDESVLKFRNIAEAETFLRRLASDPSQEAMLRSTIRATKSAYALDRDKALKEVSSLLVSGQLQIIRTQPVRRAGGQQIIEEEIAPQRQNGRSSNASPKAAWIEILLRDADGQPVNGERYKIKLPDGSIQEGKLDTFGHAEYYNINPGQCQVCFPDLMDDEWTAA